MFVKENPERETERERERERDRERKFVFKKVNDNDFTTAAIWKHVIVFIFTQNAWIKRDAKYVYEGAESRKSTGNVKT